MNAFGALTAQPAAEDAAPRAKTGPQAGSGIAEARSRYLAWVIARNAGKTMQTNLESVGLASEGAQIARPSSAGEVWAGLTSAGIGGHTVRRILLWAGVSTARHLPMNQPKEHASPPTNAEAGTPTTDAEQAGVQPTNALRVLPITASELASGYPAPGQPRSAATGRPEGCEGQLIPPRPPHPGIDPDEVSG